MSARLSFQIKGLRKQLEEYCIFEGQNAALTQVKDKRNENVYMEKAAQVAAKCRSALISRVKRSKSDR